MRERASQRRALKGTSAAHPTRADCEADTLEGLEQFAVDELNERLGITPAVFDDGTLRFRYTGDLRALLDLRSVIAVYLVRRFDVPRPRALLGHQHFEALIATIDTALRLFPPDTYRTLRVSAAGEDSSVLVRLKEELARRSGLVLAPDEGDLLLRLRRSDDREGWDALVRLSPRPLATRAWRVCNLPGAMNATLAYAMARMTRPSASDRVLNLACGSGTLLIERLMLGKARWALGCDTDLAALECARANLQAAGVASNARLEPWDATSLPLPGASADVICADLPFGQLVGSHRENEQLYPRILAEASRVATPAARMVLLTHEVRLLERAVAAHVQQWRIEEVVRVRSGGMTPRIFLLRKR